MKTEIFNLNCMGDAILSIILFCICVSLLSCKLCMMMLNMGLLLVCVSMWGSLLWLGVFFSSCELWKFHPFMVMVFGRQLKKIITLIDKKGNHFSNVLG
jgi:hypothetical protein